MDTLTFQLEAWPALWPEFAHLMYSVHAPEVSQFQDHMQVSLDESFHQAMYDLGRLDSATIRDGDVLVGYFISAVMPNPHFVGVKSAYMIHYFVQRSYRGKGLGSQLLRFATACLQARGVECVWAGAKTSQHMNHLFERQGWTEVETLFSKWLQPQPEGT